jgi:hypothetical protein
MLSQKDIDSLMIQIQSGEDAYVYYVAHMIEGRETDILDEHTYKDVPRFRVVKIKVKDIQNAYFEYMNYLNNPSNYHTEQEECYYTSTAKYIHYFITPNGKSSYSVDLNPRMPSIIYGYKRKIYIGENVNTVVDETPVNEVYVNDLEYGDMTAAQVKQALSSGKLKWKYLTLDNYAIVDGIQYKYITSDWYILDFENYPMIEKPLINTKQYSAYFIDIRDAFNYMDQLIA